MKVSGMISSYFDRWLSKGRALERVWKVREELVQFLEDTDSDESRSHLALLLSEDASMDLAFLVDIMRHMNDLNVKLQGEKKDVGQMWLAVKGFVAKLNVFHQDITESKDHFPTLRRFIEQQVEHDMAQAACKKAEKFIGDLQNEFLQRFATCKKIDSVIDLITVPRAADKEK